MGVEILRIDDRLVHGQVVEGWLRALRVTHIIVASDAVAADDTQKALYYLAVPHGVALSCLTLDACAAFWRKGQWEREKALVLASSPADVVRLWEAGAPIKSVNVGGLHFRQGRVQILKAVSLDDKDVEALRTLAAHGVVLEARPLPLDEPIDLKLYLDRWQEERSALDEQPR